VRDEVLNGKSQLLGRLPETQQLQLNIVLPLRDKAGLDDSFDRTRDLSKHPAARIASTAQAFGQEDDITVLTVRRLER